MGLVRKANVDDVAAGEAGSVATGKPGTVDMASVIRRAVTEEIERRRLASLEADATADTKAAAGSEVDPREA